MNKRKKTIIIVALLLVVFIGSISYALWSVTLEQTGSNVVKTGCFTVNMKEESDAISLAEAYPITDSDGWDYDPFTFTIQNTCTIDSSYSVNLEVGTNTNLNESSVKTVLDFDEPKVLTEYETVAHDDDVKSKYQLTTGTLAGASSEGADDGESITYNLRLWLDENTPESEMSKDFYAKIVVENITTSNVVAREALAILDYSRNDSDDVTVNYYNTGLIEIVGNGEMSIELTGIIEESLNYLLVNNSKLSSIMAQMSNLSTTAQSFVHLAAIASFGSYKAVTETMLTGTGVSLDNVTNNEELYNTLIESINSNAALFTEADLELLPDLIKTITTEIKQIKSVKISEGITSIGERVFKYFENVDIVMPSTIQKIGEEAFAYAYVNLYLNDELTTISATGAFAYSRFETLELPSNLSSIGVETFRHSSIESIVLPKGITTLNIGTFASTTNLKSIVILGEMTKIYPNAIDDLSENPNLVIKFAMTEDKKSTILNISDQPFDFTNYNVVWGYTE